MEQTRWYRPAGLPGVEALHASFETHAYRPHSHPTWTVALVERGAAAFTVDDRDERADRGQLFVLEPEAVHTGMPAVPEGWAYRVLYLDPLIVSDWAHDDRPAPRAARWVVFEDERLAGALHHAHTALAEEEPGASLGRDEALLAAVEALKPHLRTSATPHRVARHGEHPAVRRALAHLRERWDQPVALADLAGLAGLSRFELVRRFRAQVGLPPHAFQTQLRITEAKRLLEAGRPPAEVAVACGFHDQPHLTRTFRRHVGVPPGRYATAKR